MKCLRCQAENPTGTRFCGQCAAPFASVCPSCGAGNPPENKFCGQCTAPLDKPARPRFGAPESYTEVTARRDPPEHADGHYRDALALAEELGMHPLVAHCHLGLGKLSRRTGNGQQAREHLTTAITMYREMEMGFWLEQVEAELRALA